jgi:SET domain-containing protein
MNNQICRYIVVETQEKGYVHPYDHSPKEIIWMSKRIFLKALRDIEAGEELLVDYGSTYEHKHFLKQQSVCK